MTNPTIDELQNSADFELIGQLDHNEIKDFVLGKLMEGGRMVRVFMYYQLLMVLLGLFFVARAIVLAFRGIPEPFYYTMAAAVFSLTLLVLIHELLHGVALKLTGAKDVHFGAYLKKFIFYAGADRHVLNHRQFAFIALAPLVAVKIATLAGIMFLFNNPAFYFPLAVMAAHSLFCAGDIGLLAIFQKYPGSEIYTFDVKDEKSSYYYKRIDG